MEKKDFLKKLSDLTGVEVTKITEIVNQEGDTIEGIELPQLHIFTEQELTDKLKNHAEKSRPTFIEMAIKEKRNELKEKFGVDFEGKTIENLFSAAIEAGKKEAGIKPNEKVTELNGVIEKLQNNLKTIETDWQTKFQTKESELKTVKNNLFIKSIIPNDLDTTLSTDKVAALFNLDIKINQDEAGKRIFVDANGNELRNDKTQNPLNEQEVVTMWLDQNNLKRKQGNGRGEGNNFGNPDKKNLADIKSNEDFYAYCEQNKIAPKDRGTTLVEVQKITPDFRLQ